jgi:hypothetical protein
MHEVGGLGVVVWAQPWEVQLCGQGNLDEASGEMGEKGTCTYMSSPLVDGRLDNDTGHPFGVNTI